VSFVVSFEGPMTTTALMRKQLFINNEWRDAAGGKTLEVVNPATEEVIAEVASAEKADVDAAVASARAALDGPWGTLSARERGTLIWKLGEKLLEKGAINPEHHGRRTHRPTRASANCLGGSRIMPFGE